MNEKSDGDATAGNIGTGTHTYRELMREFKEDSLPDLDTAVLAALELFAEVAPPAFPLPDMLRPLVLGSGNAGVVGRMLFESVDAYFADESTCKRALSQHPDVASAVIVSASGAKDADDMARTLAERQIPTWLLTNNTHAPARECLEPERTFVFPKNREPYTYNVSAYLGMVLAYTHEDVFGIVQHITDTTAKLVPETLSRFDAFYFIIPPQFILLKEMFLTKFDELFGARVSARVFTLAETKHAKTVVPSETECFISFGEENTPPAGGFGEEKTRIHIPLPENAGYAAMMAIGYYVIGQIQKQHPPYFKENIAAYVKRASELFEEAISVIAE